MFEIINDTHQDSSYARWASELEIKSVLHRIEFNDSESRFGGIPLFSDSSAVYVEQTDTHSLIIGSTGSKKTRLIGMPALCSYTLAGESFIATDPKAELYEKSYPLLKKHGYKIIVINLRDPLKSDSWNPLMIPYRLYWSGKRDKAIEQITDMANCIFGGTSSTEPYWENSASDMLSGLILTLFECAKENEINFKSLRALRTQAFKNIGDNDTCYISKNFLNHLNYSTFVYSLLCGTAEVGDTTRDCIVSVFDQGVRPFFSQENLINMLSVNDFDMSSIGKEKTAVFLITPDENTVYHPLISVFVKQCYTELISSADKQENKKLPRRVNFLLDEFASLPAISDFPAMITASRSRDIRFILIVQSLTQLNKSYGHQAQIIKGNCENWVYLHSRDLSLLEELIGLAGKRWHDVPLLTVSKLQTLDKAKGEALIILKRLYPYIAFLPDIDTYSNIFPVNELVQYPENTRKALNVFNFETFCKFHSNAYLSKLFSGEKPEENCDNNYTISPLFPLENEDEEEYMRVPKMELIDWIGEVEDELWKRDTNEYMGHLDYKNLQIYEQQRVEKLLVDYIIEQKICFNGYYHQNAPNCIPIFQYENKTYYLAVSMRSWGDIMARAWAVINNKTYQSINEFSEECDKRRKGKTDEKTKKYVEGEYYNYVDFAWNSPDKIEWKLVKLESKGDKD